MNVFWRRFATTATAFATLLAAIAAVTVGSTTAYANAGPGSTMSTGILEAATWANELACTGPTCTGTEKATVTVACGVPVLRVVGSFIVSAPSWEKHEAQIDNALDVLHVASISANYVLIETQIDSTWKMRSLQRKGIEITMNTLSFYSGVWGFYPNADPVQVDSTMSTFDPVTLPGIGSDIDIVTVDTGAVRNTENRDLNYALIGSFEENVDEADDSVTGHGPAIADQVGDMTDMLEDPRRKSWLKAATFAGLETGGAVGPRGRDAHAQHGVAASHPRALATVNRRAQSVRRCENLPRVVPDHRDRSRHGEAELRTDRSDLSVDQSSPGRDRGGRRGEQWVCQAHLPCGLESAEPLRRRVDEQGRPSQLLLRLRQLGRVVCRWRERAR